MKNGTCLRKAANGIWRLRKDSGFAAKFYQRRGDCLAQMESLAWLLQDQRGLPELLCVPL